MLYKILFCIGSLIILAYLSATYFRSLKRLNEIVFRQKVYKSLFIIAFISITFDIFELYFYNNGPDILYIL